MTLPFDATDQLRHDGVQIIDAARRAGLDAPVPSCPGWDMGDLLWHVSEVWTFWTHVVTNGVTERAQLAQYREPVRPDDALLFDWTAASHNGLHAALTQTPPDTEIWTWTGANRDVWWVRRRMAHETVVHRWDAERVVGDAFHISTRVAADGIDEFLQWFSWRRRTEPLAGSAHLHCTDTSPAENGEWMITRLDGEGVDMVRQHGKADAAIRGPAENLLLWLWGRDGGEVEVLGDPAIAERLENGVDRR